MYLVTTQAALAITYNDRSPWENHHCATLFQILAGANEDFTVDWESEDIVAFRKIVIGCILATDMSVHFSKLAQFKALSMNSGSI